MRLGTWLGSLCSQLILVTSVIASTPLTTLAPCPEAPPELSIKPITVTTRLQAVSTCYPSSLCVRGRCSTSFLFETYAYISTVIPCAWNGTTVQSTTVTRTDQLIIVSEAYTTRFKRHSTAAAGHWQYFYFPRYGHGRPQKQEREILTKRVVASFQDIGPFAIPGWAGSDSSSNIESHKLHSCEQHVEVFECRLSKRWRKCMVWQETWVFRPDLRFSSSVIIPVHTSVKVPSRGVYVWKFPQVIPPKTLTARTSTITVILSDSRTSTSLMPAQTYSVQPYSWTAYATRTCSGPTVLDFTIYVTTTITYTLFSYTQPPTT
jgi:hypothetical protein